MPWRSPFNPLPNPGRLKGDCRRRQLPTLACRWPARLNPGRPVALQLVQQPVARRVSLEFGNDGVEVAAKIAIEQFRRTKLLREQAGKGQHRYGDERTDDRSSHHACRLQPLTRPLRVRPQR